ncbi:MAG: hypothetical protein WAV20_06430, partial [Blastocatellia bacterium]
ILFIAAAHDRRMPPEVAQSLYNGSTSSMRDLLVVDGPGSEIHGHAFQADQALYVSRVAQFLDSTLGDR